MEILERSFWSLYLLSESEPIVFRKRVTEPDNPDHFEDCKKIIAEAGEKPAAKKTTRKKKA